MCSAGIIINDIEVFQHEQLQVDLPFFRKIRVTNQNVPPVVSIESQHDGYKIRYFIVEKHG